MPVALIGIFFSIRNTRRFQSDILIGGKTVTGREL